jgi:hypothetical protein
MNVTAAQKRIRSFRHRITLQQFTLIAGLALAVGAAISLGGLRNESSSIPARATAPTADFALPKSIEDSVATARHGTNELVYYLVSTPEQAVKAQEIETWISDGLVDAPLRESRSVHVRLVTTPEEERAINDFLSFVSWDVSENTVLKIVDLR